MLDLQHRQRCRGKRKLVHPSPSPGIHPLTLRGLAFYGGSFNPPTPAHRGIAEHLLGLNFEKVILKPCGIRSDKLELKQHQSERIEQIRLRLHFDHPSFQLDCSGIDLPMVPTIEEWRRLRSTHPGRPIWLVVGMDLIEDEGQGRCQVQRWYHGQHLFDEASFLIFPRRSKRRLIFPPHHHVVEDFEPIDISSTQLRSQGITRPDAAGAGHG